MPLPSDYTRCDSKFCPRRNDCARQSRPDDVEVFPCFVQDPYLIASPCECGFFIPN